MTNKERSKFLKIILFILSAWVTFLLSLMLLFYIFSLTQIVAEGSTAGFILAVLVIIGGFFAYKVASWQTRFLNTKPLDISYLVLTLLILISIISTPVPFLFFIY